MEASEAETMVHIPPRGDSERYRRRAIFNQHLLGHALIYPATSRQRQCRNQSFQDHGALTTRMPCFQSATK